MVETDIKLMYRKVSDLLPYENNPRYNDDAVDVVAKSIEEFGFKVPIVVDKNDVIVAGHTRLKACKKLGIETVPVILADDLTEEQVKEFRLVDNKVSEYSKWDLMKLEEELAESTKDLSEFGFIKYDEIEFVEEEVKETTPTEKAEKILRCPCCGKEVNLNECETI